MRQNEFDCIVRELNGLALSVTDEHPGATRECLDEVMTQLSGALVRNTFSDRPRGDDVKTPNLLDAVLKVLFIYRYNQWLVDDSLFSLLHFAMSTGSRNRLTKIEEEAKERRTIGAWLDKVWSQIKASRIPVAEQARILRVSRPTIDKWRKESDYQTVLKESIDDAHAHGLLEAFIENARYTKVND